MYSLLDGEDRLGNDGGSLNGSAILVDKNSSAAGYSCEMESYWPHSI